MRAEQHIAVGEGGLYSALLGKEKEDCAEQSQDGLYSTLLGKEKEENCAEESQDGSRRGVTHRFSPTSPQRPMKLRLSLNITLWKMIVGKCILHMIIIHQRTELLTEQAMMIFFH